MVGRMSGISRLCDLGTTSYIITLALEHRISLRRGAAVTTITLRGNERDKVTSQFFAQLASSSCGGGTKYQFSAGVDSRMLGTS